MSDSGDMQASQEAHPVNTAAQRTLGPFRVNDWYALDELEDGSSIELLWAFSGESTSKRPTPARHSRTVPDTQHGIAETWSPDDSMKEHADKAAAYAMAGVLHFWTLDQDESGMVTAVNDGRYIEQMKAVPGVVTEFDVAGVPVKFDPADLAP